MEQLMLEQFMKLSAQIGEIKGEVHSLRTEMKEGFKEVYSVMDARFKEQDEKFEKRFKEQDEKFEQRFKEQDEKFENRFDKQDERFDSLEKEMREGFKQQSKENAAIRQLIYENAQDTSYILHDIIRSLENNGIEVVNFNG